MKNNICILFHCIYEDGIAINGPHQELFVSKSEIRILFEELLARKYTFSLPWEFNQDQKNCVLTFDDGYYNNINVLPICNEYKIPLIQFINSYNILTGKPFIWDIWEDNFKDEYPFGKASSRELYNTYNHRKFYGRLENDLYRPFNLDELRDFANDQNVQLGFHSHHHQPLVKRAKNEWENEMVLNKQFFVDHNLAYVNDFSLPCGLYTFDALGWARSRFERIYTINGGMFNDEDTVINRISLVSPRTSGKSLIEQIDQSINPTLISQLKNTRNHLRRMKYAYVG